MLITSQDPGRMHVWFAALLLAWLATSLVLYFASCFGRFLKPRGLIAMERLMGMVLVTIAIQIMLTGIKEFLVG